MHALYRPFKIGLHPGGNVPVSRIGQKLCGSAVIFHKPVYDDRYDGCGAKMIKSDKADDKDGDE